MKADVQGLCPAKIGICSSDRSGPLPVSTLSKSLSSVTSAKSWSPVQLTTSWTIQKHQDIKCLRRQEANGRVFVAANGLPIPNKGEMIFELKLADAAISSKFQVGKIYKPIWSIANICDA